MLPIAQRFTLVVLAILATSLPLLASPGALVSRDDVWFRSPDGREAVANVLSWQSPHGSWPKNRDTPASRFEGKPKDLQGTFDNGATTGEIRFLARAAAVTGDERCRAAVVRGIDHILEAQYPNGGWPQFFPPPPKSYHCHITYNDGSMQRLLELLRELDHNDDFAFLDTDRRSAARRAFARGIDCILKTQVVVDGRPTVWCAQHDAVTLKPAPARSYEHATLSGSESAGILIFLMSLDDPSPQVVQAVRAGVAWFENSALDGIRVERKNGDTTVTKDRKAPAVWARFYDITTKRPIFSGRDGVVKYQLSEIERERRGGYAWYGNWGHKVSSAYRKWKHR